MSAPTLTPLRKAIHAINARFVSGNSFPVEKAMVPAVEVAAILAHIEALEADAERYRWLRRGEYPIDFARNVLNDTPFGIDAAIDAARKEADRA